MTLETADSDVASTLEPGGGERAGRYELFAEIGAGGMARVHVGRLLGAAGFARTVAVKRPLPALTRDDDFRRAASNEARLAARVHHPNVVPTLDVVEHGDELLIVMEYVHGESLSALAGAARGRGERVPLGIVAALVGGALRGLEAVHAARDERGRPLGLIHRDVSPQNILVGVDGLPRLSDFGLAKAAGQANLTGRDEFKGKLTYASPEQIALGPLSPATDLYSMGIVLWELLAAERLYAGMTAAEIVVRLLGGGSVPAPSRAAAGAPPLLDPVIERATRRAPGERFESAAAMAEALACRVEPAPPGEVAAWVRALAGRSLAARERLVMAAERQTTPSRRGSSLPPVGPAGASAGQGDPATSFELAVTMPFDALALPPARSGAAPAGFGTTLASANPRARTAELGGDARGRTAELGGDARGRTAELGGDARGRTAELGGGEGGLLAALASDAGGPPAAPHRASLGATAIRVSGVVVGASLAFAAAKLILPHAPVTPQVEPAGSPSAFARPAAPNASGGPSAEAAAADTFDAAAVGAPAPSSMGPVAEASAPPAPGARSASAHAPPRKQAPAAGRPEADKPEPRRDHCSPPYSLDAEGIRHMKPGCQ